MIRSISIILLLAISSGLFAQKQDTIPAAINARKQDTIPPSPAARKQDSIQSGINSRKQLSPASRLEAQKTDTLKKTRILRQWNLSSDFAEEVSIPFDTVFSLFNRYRIADRYSPVNATLGNYGLPFYQINFFDRITDPDKFLYYYYAPFMHTPDKAVFMNTQVPFTELIWSFAGPTETSEQTFRVRHSQNVNRFLNFGLIYDVIFSLGQYSYQRSEDKTFTFYSSYTGEKYKLYFSAGINNLISFENGGITTKDAIVQNSTRDVPINLGGNNKASSSLKNRSLLLVQKYTFSGSPALNTDSISKKRSGFFGLSGTFSHIFIAENNKRSYSDGFAGSGFYDTIFIDNDVTFDSLSSRSIKNTVRFDFSTDETRKFSLGGGIGIRNELFRYSQIVPTHILPLADTTSSDTATWNRGNNVLVGRLFNSIGEKFRWIANGELFLTGFRAGDFMLNGEITKSFDWKRGRALWLITGSITNRQPSFWYDRWGSNHFEWHTTLNKELRIDVGSAFSYPARKAELKFNYAIIHNYTDFGPDAMPAQFSGALSVAAVSLRKEMRAWKFHLSTDLLLQQSSNPEVLDLPMVTTRTAGYFEHLFRFESTGGKLNTQLGVDVTFHTLYHPYTYMPATGRFYRQDVSTGNYPFVNLFLNFKVKRTRFFIMFDHLNYGMMGSKIGNNYDMIPNYPMNIRVLRYGLAWTFYD